MISVVYSNAMAEVLEYLKGIRKEDIDRIPEKFMNYLRENASKDYICNFDTNDSFENMNLLPETKVIIASICYSYWCSDDLEKNKLKEILSKNEKDYEAFQREKYNPDNLFKSNEHIEQELLENKKEVLVVPEKDNIIVRIIKKIKNFFKKEKN